MSRPKLSDQIRRLSQEAEALELRKQGLSRDVIGQRLGVAGRTVDRLIARALERIIERPAEEVRKLELERLDVMLAGLWEAASHGGYLSVDRVLGIMDRRAKLQGLDAPTKVELYEFADKLGLPDDEKAAVVAEVEAMLRGGTRA